MSEERSAAETDSATRDWPTYTLTCTFNPATANTDRPLEPDEVYVFDPTRTEDDGDTKWIAAKRGSYLSLEETR